MIMRLTILRFQFQLRQIDNFIFRANQGCYSLVLILSSFSYIPPKPIRLILTPNLFTNMFVVENDARENWASRRRAPNNDRHLLSKGLCIFCNQLEYGKMFGKSSHLSRNWFFNPYISTRGRSHHFTRSCQFQQFTVNSATWGILIFSILTIP